jgi:dTDP-4-amino-4,6-dideoxygalactose transaminase
MLTAISRYGLRVPPCAGRVIAECSRRGELVQGPRIGEFEESFAGYHGGGEAITASYGRMAFRYILQALELPAGSEVIFPALTFWVIPEMARTLGLRPVFADIDPVTFNLDPDALERAVTEHTRAVVPTHLYGLPCDIEALLRVAERHNLHVIEDCAHSLGARYRGRRVGTFGDAAFFSFQSLKPLNTFGGGMALVRDRRLASSVRKLAAAEPWPDQTQTRTRLRLGRLQQFFTRPVVFSLTGFPLLWLSSWFRMRPDIYLWEKIRPLDPLPVSYRQRYSNVQAALGLAGLNELERWNAETRAHVDVMIAALDGRHEIRLPELRLAANMSIISSASTCPIATRSCAGRFVGESTWRPCTSTFARVCRSFVSHWLMRLVQSAPPRPYSCRFTKCFR